MKVIVFRRQPDIGLPALGLAMEEPCACADRRVKDQGLVRLPRRCYRRSSTP